MEWFIWVLLASVLSTIGSGIGVAWLILRPSGVLERLQAAADTRVNTLSQSCEDLNTRMVNIEAELTAAKGLVTTSIDAIGSRMSSFESRYGKLTKETERQRQIEEAFAIARTQNGVTQ